MNWLNEFQKRIDAIDNRIENPPVQKREIRGEVEKPTQPLYNLHKRSLPVGLDRPVAFRLLLEDCTRLLKLLKPKVVDQENRTVHYYDRVREDGYKGGVYDNELGASEILRRDSGSDSGPNSFVEPHWQG